ncbi:MAG: DUF4982 domain-containing protein, partial [Phycisphaerae bacterium]|nr:DUF4982 domain-containing protein [Phycisphaerae bacterium]MDW8263227.1 DUF4982 domain-containing protein [Phycisphaerales bacterium]
IPYKWPCTSSHFGLMDLCGFPKDLYWYFRAWWGSAPVLHLFPHWNWAGREGQPLEVVAYTNHQEVELQVNGRSLGRQPVERNGQVAWTVEYEPGRLEAIGYRSGRAAGRTIVETTGPLQRLALSREPLSFAGSASQYAIATVRGCDLRGRTVPTAAETVYFRVSGPAEIVGVGNGDPASHEPEKASYRRLFHGLAQVILRRRGSGRVTLEARAEGLPAASVRI